MEKEIRASMRFFVKIWMIRKKRRGVILLSRA
jgi:hypothetical protein